MLTFYTLSNFGGMDLHHASGDFCFCNHFRIYFPHLPVLLRLPIPPLLIAMISASGNRTSSLRRVHERLLSQISLRPRKRPHRATASVGFEPTTSAHLGGALTYTWANWLPYKHVYLYVLSFNADASHYISWKNMCTYFSKYKIRFHPYCP